MLNFSVFFKLLQGKQSYVPVRVQDENVARKISQRGFTLIELMVTIIIFLIITSVVVFRFMSFDSVTLLKTLAYDVALSVRDAQASALSVQGTATSSSQLSFRIPYGVSFTPDMTDYVFFAYTGGATRPFYDTLNSNIVDVLGFSQGYTISDVCIKVSGVEDCSITRLDISFRRPEYTSWFYALNSSNIPLSEVQNAAIETGIIKIESANGLYTGIVEVGSTGYVAVRFQ